MDKQFFVYCARGSMGARELASALPNGKRVRRFDGMNFWSKGKRLPLRQGDVVVCWGGGFPKIEGIRVLNPEGYTGKLAQAIKLTENGIPTIEVYPLRQQPREGVGSVWLPRENDHTGGSDLLTRPARPDYWVKKEDFVREYRLHVFSGKSIRAGQKVLREGFIQVEEPRFRVGGNLAHPWIRSYDAGWKISYDGFSSTKQMRALAAKAVETLKLDFGAVDMALRANQQIVVLEVNRGPGAEGNTVTAYAEAIQKWASSSQPAGREPVVEPPF